MCCHVHAHIQKEFIYLVCENEVFGKHKTFLRVRSGTFWGQIMFVRDLNLGGAK